MPYLIEIPVLEEVWAEFERCGFWFISLFVNNLVSSVTSIPQKRQSGRATHRRLVASFGDWEKEGCWEEGVEASLELCVTPLEHRLAPVDDSYMVHS